MNVPPTSSNGSVVSAPTERLVSPIGPVTGYTTTVRKCGIPGEVITHGSPVWSNHIERCQPSSATTVRLAPMPNSPLMNRAYSPIVIPYSTGTGYMPMNELHRGSSTGPATRSPESGSGRSSTTMGIPWAAAACIASASVDV